MKKAKQLTKPRNPMIAAVLFKKSGAHGKSQKALRREARVQIKRKIDPSDA
jgi:hypothetical protein